MNETVLWILLVIGVIIGMASGGATIYLNEKKYRIELMNYYDDLTNKQEETIEMYKQKVKRLKTKLYFYEKMNEDV